MNKLFISDSGSLHFPYKILDNVFYFKRFHGNISFLWYDIRLSTLLFDSTSNCDQYKPSEENKIENLLTCFWWQSRLYSSILYSLDYPWVFYRPGPGRKIGSPFLESINGLYQSPVSQTKEEQEGEWVLKTLISVVNNVHTSDILIHNMSYIVNRL